MIPKSDVAFTLFTDASLTGYGAVLIDNSTQKIHITAGMWFAPENIAVLEARALHHGLTLLEGIGDRAQNARVDVFIDNTTVLYSYQKRISRNFLINSILLRCFAIIADIQLHVNLAYVKSEDNIADDPSRLSLGVLRVVYFEAQLSHARALSL